MRRLLVVLLGLGLVGWPLPIRADPAPVPSPVASNLPLDEESAAKQVEVEQRVLGFLQTLHRHWGQSRDTLRKTVTGTIERDERDTLIYSRTLADHGILEGYEFRDGTLVRGQYLVLQRPVYELNEFIDYYAAVKQSLITLYGTPAEDQLVWNNDLYQPLPDYWGVAVQIGHLRYAARWETPDGAISIELTGNHHSRLMIEYRSNDFIEDARTT